MTERACRLTLQLRFEVDDDVDRSVVIAALLHDYAMQMFDGAGDVRQPEHIYTHPRGRIVSTYDEGSA
jgi:hypothetical protein